MTELIYYAFVLVGGLFVASSMGGWPGFWSGFFIWVAGVVIPSMLSKLIK